MNEISKFLNLPILNVVREGRVKSVAGDLFGVEIELEGRNISPVVASPLLNGWGAHADGSLRANHGEACEWVFNNPVNYVKSVERVNNLFKWLDTNKASIVPSNRTSVHVHYNMSDKYIYQLVNMFILYTIFEGLFDRYCGEDRTGNLFCLSSRYAEEQILWMDQSCFKFQNLLEFSNDRRYCSLNLASLHKFGSVEFRGMRGLDNSEELVSWLNILSEFCNYSCYTMRNPDRIIEDISMLSPIGFLQQVFNPDNIRNLTKGLSLDEVNASIYEGLRLIQPFSYRISNEWDKVKVKKKDFWVEVAEKNEGRNEEVDDQEERLDQQIQNFVNMQNQIGAQADLVRARVNLARNRPIRRPLEEF